MPVQANHGNWKWYDIVGPVFLCGFIGVGGGALLGAFVFVPASLKGTAALFKFFGCIASGGIGGAILGYIGGGGGEAKVKAKALSKRNVQQTSPNHIAKQFQPNNTRSTRQTVYGSSDLPTSIKVVEKSPRPSSPLKPFSGRSQSNTSV